MPAMMERDFDPPRGDHNRLGHQAFAELVRDVSSMELQLSCMRRQFFEKHAELDRARVRLGFIEEAIRALGATIT